MESETKNLDSRALNYLSKISGLLYPHSRVILMLHDETRSRLEKHMPTHILIACQLKSYLFYGDPHIVS